MRIWHYGIILVLHLHDTSDQELLESEISFIQNYFAQSSFSPLLVSHLNQCRLKPTQQQVGPQIHNFGSHKGSLKYNSFY